MDPSSDNSSAVSKRQLADKTIFQHQSSYRTMRWNSKLLFLLLKALKNILDRMLSNSVMKILKEILKLGHVTFYLQLALNMMCHRSNITNVCK